MPGCRPGRCWWLCFALWLHGGGLGLGLGGGLFVELWPVGWGLAMRLWLGPPWFSCWFSFALACGGVGLECSSLFVVVVGLIFVFPLWCVGWVGGLCANRGFVCVLGVASGPGVGLAGCGGALDPPVVCSAGRSEAVVPGLVLLLVALWFILRGNLLCVFPCVVLFLCFSVLLVLRLPRLGRGGGGGGGGWSLCSRICTRT